jgi:hypothetical protein
MYDMHVTTESVDRYFFTLVSCDWTEVTEPQRQACGVSVSSLNVCGLRPNN